MLEWLSQAPPYLRSHWMWIGAAGSFLLVSACFSRWVRWRLFVVAVSLSICIVVIAGFHAYRSTGRPDGAPTSTLALLMETVAPLLQKSPRANEPAPPVPASLLLAPAIRAVSTQPDLAFPVPPLTAPVSSAPGEALPSTPVVAPSPGLPVLPLPTRPARPMASASVPMPGLPERLLAERLLMLQRAAVEAPMPPRLPGAPALTAPAK